MPWFRHATEDHKESEESERRRLTEEDQIQKESLASLAAGGIPIHAQRRLDELRSRPDGFFTSDLTVSEFALVRQVEFRPLTQVMGSSVYHVGWQSLPASSWRMWAQQSQELTVISNAMNHSRTLALGRLAEEAKRAGANAVVGVHVTRGEYDWASDLVEFSCVGTAVRWKDAPPSEHPYLTNLSGQDFWKLYQSGYWPVGVVAGSTVFYVIGGWLANASTRGMWGARMNMEVQEFSAGVNAARRRAMDLVYDQARKLQGSGVVGMEIEQDQTEHEVQLGNDQERKDMICTFQAMGTAITELKQMPERRKIISTLSLQG
ncbi:MAG: heavy metal-binding domain-containing protein [Chloroflexota bacterium]|nr:MAG: hypothetical protein DLM70_18295 [Chloroflexota bacterium]